MSARRRRQDIDFTSTVEADELRFHEVPETRVEFVGHPDYDAADGSRRTGLPDSVEAGVTYRHVRVDYRIRSSLSGESEAHRLGDPRDSGRDSAS